jgi:hypothetical protein
MISRRRKLFMKLSFPKVFICLLVVALTIAIISCGSQTTAKEVTTTLATTTAPATTAPATTTPTEAQLFLEIASPADKSSVTSAETTVTGKTLPIAIVSINGILVKVGADGSFSSLVQLELGPNVIQIEASTISGEEVGKVLAVGRTQ